MRTTVGSICHQAAICLPATVGGRSRVAETGQTEICAVLSLPEQDRDCGTDSVLFGVGFCNKGVQSQVGIVYPSPEAVA